MNRAVLPYGRQWIEDDDIDAVVQALRSDYLTTGPEVEAFETELAGVCGARFAIAVSNGTAALHCAYAAAGIGAGDEVITSPLTFSATANMVLALGAKPVFADVLADTLCLDPARAEEAITAQTKAIAAVDFAGHPAQMDELRAVAQRHRLGLIEDAAHSLGSRFLGSPVGRLADMTTLSFHPVKTITTAEGGAVLTDDAALARCVRDFRNHGMVKDPERLARHDGPWYYEIQSLGFNYRLSAIQCALGRSQLRKLERFIGRRAQLVARYRAGLTGLPLDWVTEGPGVQPAWHLFAVRVRGGSKVRASLFSGLQKKRIVPQVHYIAVNELPLYRQLGYSGAETPVASEASNALISLPLFPAMSDGDVDYVIGAVREVFDELH